MAAAEGEEEAMAQPSAPAQDAEDRTAQDPASASGREEPAPAPGATQPQLDSPLVERLLEAVEAVAAIPGDYRNNAHGRHFAALARRVKLLAPLFEELRDGGGCGNQQQQHNHQRRLLSAVAEAALRDVGDAVRDARDLLVLGTQGSKIWLVLEGDQILKRFQEVTSRLEHALDGVPFDELDISDEVREQVELVHSQLKRAKERIDLPDADLYTDLLSIYNSGADDTTTDNAIVLRRLADKLQLTTIADLKQESVALQEMVIANGGEDPGENIEKMCMLLKKIKDYVQTQNPEMGALSSDKAVSSPVRVKMPVIPDDFRCPISLELMNDPVIVSTGQTYERDAIEKWLQAGHSTCPKTQETLNSKSLTPNYVLRSLIAQWCEANGLESPKRPLNTQQNKAPSCSCSEHAKIVALVQQLSSSECDDQRSAASQLRLLAKCNADNRICIADAGAIPLLVSLLPTPDPGTQEHAVTALLNLSIYEENKGIIVSSEAVPGIVHVLKKGSMEARENAAATLFSLSVIDEYKVRIGAVSGAIPALALLLKEGTQRGKKDAATALFNLCIYQGNKGKAIRAGVIPTLMSLLTDPAAVMVDEALAILAILASHPEGKVSIGAAKAVPVLVGIIGTGSSRSRENAAAILVHLFSGEQQYEHLIEAQQCGVMPLLFELAQNGTDRGKRKANDLIERLNRFLEQQELVQSLSQAPALAEQSNTPFPATLANK